MPPAGKTTVEEYLRLDALAEGKRELLNAVVVAMAGASPRHNLIVANLVGELRASLRSGPCMIFSQDQRVRVAATESYVYPDVVVVCDEPSFDGLGRLKREEARPHLERLLNHPESWIRKEAKKGLAKLDKAATKKSR